MELDFISKEKIDIKMNIQKIKADDKNTASIIENMIF